MQENFMFEIKRKIMKVEQINGIVYSVLLILIPLFDRR